MNPTIEIKRPDYCYFCNSERAVDLFDRRNRPLRYSIFLDMYYKGKSKELEKDYAYIKCTRCGTKNMYPSYDRDRLPFLPATTINLSLFLANHELSKGD